MSEILEQYWPYIAPVGAAALLLLLRFARGLVRSAADADPEVDVLDHIADGLDDAVGKQERKQ